MTDISLAAGNPPHRIAGLRASLSALPGYATARQLDVTTVSLASNESHHDPLPGVIDAAAVALRSMNRYPDSAGTLLRERIARKVGVDVEQILLGAGSLGVLQHIISAVSEPGDEVIFPWRSFEAYPLLVRLANAIPVPVPLRDDETHDLDEMIAAIRPRTSVVLLCSPNNPTGVSIAADELSRALSRIPPRILVVLDEAYTEFVTRENVPDGIDLTRRFGNLCVVRTFSKAYGLAGLRVGYAIAAPALSADLRRTSPPFSVNAVAQASAVASLDAQEELEVRVAEIVHEREALEHDVRAFGWTVRSTDTNFLWIRCDDDTRMALETAFADEGILVRTYPGAGVRITIADASTNERTRAVLAAFPPATSLLAQ